MLPSHVLPQRTDARIDALNASCGRVAAIVYDADYAIDALHPRDVLSLYSEPTIAFLGNSLRIDPPGTHPSPSRFSDQKSLRRHATACVVPNYAAWYGHQPLALNSRCPSATQPRWRSREHGCAFDRFRSRGIAFSDTSGILSDTSGILDVRDA
jgi:hypothetical protein